MPDTDQAARDSEARVEWLFAHAFKGWRYTRADGKHPSIDGYLQMEDPTAAEDSARYLYLAVQVKSGPSYFRPPTSPGRKAGRLLVKIRDVLDWKSSNLPVIVIWVEDPSEMTTRVLWTPTKTANPRSSWLQVSLRNTLDGASRLRLLKLGQNGPCPPEIPSLAAAPSHFPQQVTQVKAAALAYYKDWRSNKCNSPALGPVAITSKGWRHITRPSGSQHSVLHKIGLLPAAREVLETSRRAKLVRRLGGRFPVKLWAVTGVARTNYRAPAIVQVIVEERLTGDGPKRAFYSVHELSSW